MTKTKKQLRAEAVERLKDAQTDNLDWMLLGDGCPNWVNYDTLSYNKTVRKRIADLLTDDDSNDYSTPEKVVSGSEPCVTPESCRQYADQRKQVDDADCESCDSREKLEADVRKHYAYSITTLMYPPSANKSTDMLGALSVDTVIGWLDRQASITAEETSNAWEEYRDATQREIAKYEHDCELLFDEKRELTAERDELRARVDYLESRHCDWADPDSLGDGCMLRKDEAFDALKAERDDLKEQLLIGWECECRLQAERDHYRSKFGKCLDYADAIHALMDDEGMA